MRIDILHGELVQLTAEDPKVMAKAFAGWNLDTEYLRLLDSDPPRLWSEQKWLKWLEKDLEKDDPNDFFFPIRTLEDERLIGFIALFDQYWNHGDTLLAIAIGERDCWNKGYGTDAMRIMQRYVFLELNLRRLSLIVFEYNQRALRSYEKAGFVVEGRVRGAMLREGRRWDWFIMGILRDEWEALNDKTEHPSQE